MRGLFKVCTAGAVLAGFAVAAHGCSIGPGELRLGSADPAEPGTTDETAEAPQTEPRAAGGAGGGPVQASSAVSALGQAYPLVQAVEDADGAVRRHIWCRGLF